jgi:methionine-rich copper-binding protein CopC
MVLVCAGLAFIAQPAPARAHTGIEDASPGPGEEAAPGVSVVALMFDTLRPDGPRQVTIIGPDGAVVPAGEPVMVNAAVLCLAVEPLPTGVHTVDYLATSGDGHEISGRYTFDVTDTAPVLARPLPCRRVALPPVANAPSPSPSPSSSGDQALAASVLIVAGGVASLAAVALVAGALALRAHRNRAPRA